MGEQGIQNINPIMNRSASLKELRESDQWDIVIVGGGASGLGAAVDAAKRGYKTLLLEKNDFAKGTFRGNLFT